MVVGNVALGLEKKTASVNGCMTPLGVGIGDTWFGEGIFQHQKSFQDKSGKVLEEERRLAYFFLWRLQPKRRPWPPHS